MIQQSGPQTVERRPLDASLFSFYNYDRDQLHTARRALGGGRMRAGPPDLDVIDGAVFVPSPSSVSRRESGPGAERPMLAGIAGHDGQPIATAHLHRGKRFSVGLALPTAVAPLEEVDEEVAYLGWLFDSYGHFLLESLARTWVLDQIHRSTRVVFHYPSRVPWCPQPWTLRMLAAFGIPRERILMPRVPTRFRRLLIPEPLFEMHRAVHERAAVPYRAVAAQLAGGTKPSAQPVYLSRRLLSGSRRQLIGEAELEDVLRENGFLVAHPETMTLDDQVRLINSHGDIFTSTGSAAHNILFALHRPRLHLLTSGTASYRSFFLCSALADVPTAFVNCLEMGERSRGSHHRWLPEVVAPARLVEYLDEIGHLKTRRRAVLAGRDPALKRDYDEAWFYASIGASARGGGCLSDAAEREATEFARTSWPVSLALAKYYARRDATRLDGMVRQLADLVAAECNLVRLARYRTDLEQLTAIAVMRCESATANRLVQVVSNQLQAEV